MVRRPWPISAPVTEQLYLLPHLGVVTVYFALIKYMSSCGPTQEASWPAEYVTFDQCRLRVRAASALLMIQGCIQAPSTTGQLTLTRLAGDKDMQKVPSLAQTSGGAVLAL